MEVIGSPKWFRSKWDRLKHLKKVEDEWFGLFTDKKENEMLDRHLKIEKNTMGRKRTKQQILNDFEKGMLRDKSEDIIVGNPFYKNDEFQKELFTNMFYDKLRDFFVDYLNKMNGEEKIYLKDGKRKIEIRKLFEQ